MQKWMTIKHVYGHVTATCYNHWDAIETLLIKLQIL